VTGGQLPPSALRAPPMRVARAHRGAASPADGLTRTAEGWSPFDDADRRSSLPAAARADGGRRASGRGARVRVGVDAGASGLPRAHRESLSVHGGRGAADRAGGAAARSAPDLDGAGGGHVAYSPRDERLRAAAAPPAGDRAPGGDARRDLGG